MVKKLVLGVALLLVGIMCGYAAQQKGLLFPDMTPEKGTFDKPFGKLGEKPPGPWSVTTVAAAVDGKPLPGKVVSVVGEVVDYSCYLQLGKHGEKHRDCGQKCLKNGMPIGLLTKEGHLYLLMEEEHNPRRDGMTNLRDTCIEQMARIMEVTGTLSELEGTRALFVTGFIKK
jgi:hypothetical protein